MQFIQRYYPLLVFIVLLLVYSTPLILDSPLCAIHLWRQTDSLSFCRYYADNGLHFFDTGIQTYLFKDYQSNKTIGEFPIIYYLTACIWKITGEQLWVLRSITLVLFSAAMLSCFKSLRLLGVSKLYATFVISFICLSPAAVLYSTNFLPDMHAISISLIACYFFLRFVYFKKSSRWWISMMLFSLAGLIKPTALIPFGVIGVLWLLERSNILKAPKQLFPSLALSVSGFLFVFISNATYLLWVAHYNNNYGGWFTPNNVFTPWNQAEEHINRYLEMAPYFLLPQVFSISAFAFLFLSALVVFIDNFSRNTLSKLVLLITFLGSLAYTILFFKWDVHDYYSLVLIPLPIVVLTCLYFRIRSIKIPMIASRLLLVCILVFMSYNILYTADHIQLRYRARYQKDYSLTTNKKEEALLKYQAWYFAEHLKHYNQIEEDLVRLGINKDVKVISLPDDSFQASLFLMNRAGWTGFERDAFTKEGIEKRKQAGAKFLLVGDMERATNMGLDTSYFRPPLDTLRNILVYDLSNTR